MGLSLLVVTYLGVIIDVTALPVSLSDCQAGLASRMPPIVSMWHQRGLSADRVEVSCVPLRSVILARGVLA